ncbi:MAG: hypothetical protein KY460_17395 [Actinobacteria bacterium]|nr:hypothetical protein [Actinomycetota bacterium]
MDRDEPEWIRQRTPASDADVDLLAFFGHAPPVDPELLRANIAHKRRYWRHQESANTARARHIAAGVVANVEHASRKLQEWHGFADHDWLRQLTPASSDRSDLLGFFGVTPTSELTLLYDNIKRKRTYWIDRAGEVSTEVLARIDDLARQLQQPDWTDQERPVSLERADLLAYFGLTHPTDPDDLARNIALKRRRWEARRRRSAGGDDDRTDAVLRAIDDAAERLVDLLAPSPPQHEQPEQPRRPPQRPPEGVRDHRRNRTSIALVVFVVSFVALRLAVAFVARSPGVRVPPVSAVVAIAAVIALRASVVGVAKRVMNDVFFAVALYVLVWGAFAAVSRIIDIAVPAGEVRLLVTLAIGVTLRYRRDRTALQQMVALVLVPTVAYLGVWAAAATLSRFVDIGMLPHVARMAVAAVVLLTGAAAVDKEFSWGVILMLVTSTVAWFVVDVVAWAIGDARSALTVTPIARLLIALAIAAVVATELGRTSQPPEA